MARAETTRPGLRDFELILGNFKRRFSGVTSTMLQVLEVQKRHVPVRVLGRHHVPGDVPAVGFRELVRSCREPLGSDRVRVFHARRNNEMIQALLLRDVFGARIRVVFTSTDQRPRTWITRMLMRRMNGLLSTSSRAARYMEVPPDRIIPHGIDTTRYCPANDRAAAWRALGLPGKHGIGIFGRVRPQKGTDLLVDAAIRVLSDSPDFTVVVVGQIKRDQRKFVSDLLARVAAAGLSGRVVFTDLLPFDRLPDVYRALSIATALSRNEGFGLTVLEAMSTGLPVIATEAGAWPDIIEDGVNGYLIPVDDVDMLTRRLRMLSGDAALRRRLGEEARCTVLSGYTVEREAQDLLDYFSGLR